MSKGVFFDTSVLVPAVCDQLANHTTSFARLITTLDSKKTTVHTSSHVLAECYATLTALPLRRRISGPDALNLIETNFIRRLKIITLSESDSLKALRRVASLGLISGQIYDALHLTAAEKSGCQTLFTYNLAHFQSLNPTLTISAP